MPKHRAGVAILVFAFAFPIWAGQTPGTLPPAPPTPQPTPPGKPPNGPPLTLEEATALAIKAHPQVGVARNEASAAGQHITEARSAYYPTIDGEITGSQGLYQSRLGAGSITTSLLFNRVGSGLQMTQLLWISATPRIWSHNRATNRKPPPRLRKRLFTMSF